LEERAIHSDPRRQRPLEQARRLTPPRRTTRRYLGPIVIVGLSLLLAGRVLLGGGPEPTPAAPLAAPDPTVEIADAVPQLEDPADAPSAPPPDPRVVAQQRLREAVFAPFRGLAGRFGIAVKDLGSGHTVLLNEALSFQAASLYKLPVMYEVFKLREWGLLTFREELTIGAEDAAMDLGSLSWPVGTRLTVGTALERMVTISDNTTAFMLARKVGAWRINEDVVDLGMSQTSVRGGNLATSAGDMLNLLELIARGRAIDEESSAEMVYLMARQQIRDRIPMLMPPEATVANKTGNWERAVHDVAIVYAPRATFIIALLSDGIADQEGVNWAMARAARNVYDLVGERDFETQAMPPLPATGSPSYAVAVKLPPTAAPARAVAAPAQLGGAATQAAPTAAPLSAVTPSQPAAPPRATAPPREAAAPTAISLPTRPPPPAPTATPALAPTAGAASRATPRPTRTPRPGNTPTSGATTAPILAPGTVNILSTPEKPR